jgi:hypothetical protein
MHLRAKNTLLCFVLVIVKSNVDTVQFFSKRYNVEMDGDFFLFFWGGGGGEMK